MVAATPEFAAPAEQLAGTLVSVVQLSYCTLLAQAPAVPCGGAEAESTSAQPQAAHSWCKQQPAAAGVGRCAIWRQTDAVRAAAGALEAC
jgi:hypothetical protein